MDKAKPQRLCNEQELRSNEAVLSTLLGICSWFVLVLGTRCFAAIPRDGQQRKCCWLRDEEELSSFSEPGGGESRLNAVKNPPTLFKGLREAEKYFFFPKLNGAAPEMGTACVCINLLVRFDGHWDSHSTRDPGCAV